MKDKLEKIFKNYKISLNSTQINQFDLYYSFLIEENKKFNLTAITEKDDVIYKHFLDSVLPFELIPQNSTLIDVGSGAGFPAIPLKILRPDLKVCMVDSLEKRVKFLNNVINLLNLEDCEAVHARAEDFAKQNRECFDLAVARAVAPLNTLCEYLLPFVKIGGMALVYKSQKLDDELACAQNAIKILGAKEKSVESFEIFDSKNEKVERKILILQKIKSTPAKYPRSSNKPKTNPIK